MIAVLERNKKKLRSDLWIALLDSIGVNWACLMALLIQYPGGMAHAL
jgi:hypothetical protein